MGLAGLASVTVQSPGCSGVPSRDPLCGKVLVGAWLGGDKAPGMEDCELCAKGPRSCHPTQVLPLGCISGVRSDCIAVDWLGRNLYWTDGAAGQVLATRLGAAWQGIPEYTVVMDGDLDQPHSLVLQPLAG